MEKLDPKAIWTFFFRSLGTGLVFILVFGWIIDVILEFAEIEIGYGLVSLILFLIIWIFVSYGWARLSYNAYKFEFTEDVFKKEYGVIWKRYITIPYGRIQNIDVQRGVLARILGLSDLMIQTAGSTAIYQNRGLLGGLGRRDAEGKLPGLSKERAEEIRENLTKMAKGAESGL